MQTAAARAFETGAEGCAAWGAAERAPARRGRWVRGLSLAAGLWLGMLGAQVARAQGELVTVTRYRLTPGTVEVQPGQTVTFVADEDESLVDAMIPVTIVFEGRFRSPPLEPGDAWRVRFDRTGLYRFFLDEHRDVEGVVIVE